MRHCFVPSVATHATVAACKTTYLGLCLHHGLLSRFATALQLLSFLGNTLAELDKLEEQLCIPSDLLPLKCLMVEQYIQVTTSVNPTDPILLQEAERLLC